MMLMAEVLGYDTAPMEGFEQDKVCETLRLPMSYWVVALLAIGHLKGRTSSTVAASIWLTLSSPKSMASRSSRYRKLQPSIGFRPACISILRT
jgi:nitroreductase